MRRAAACLLALAGLSAAQSGETFTGVVTDDMCPLGDHAGMQMGPTEAECVKACVESHGSSFVLYDGSRVYQLSDQRTPERFAAQRVRVVGTLDARTQTIQVRSMSAAE